MSGSCPLVLRGGARSWQASIEIIKVATQAVTVNSGGKLCDFAGKVL